MEYKVKDLIILRNFMAEFLDVKGRGFSKVLNINLNITESTMERVKKDFMIKYPITLQLRTYIEKSRKVLIKYAEKDDKEQIYLDVKTQKPVIKRIYAYDKAMKIINNKHRLGKAELLHRDKAWLEVLNSRQEVKFIQITREGHLPREISTRDRMGLAFMLHKRLTGCL